MRTAVAYLTDTLLCPVTGVSRREDQKERIRRYAAENDINVVAWFEDEMCTPDPMDRSGVRGLLEYAGPCDLVLVDHAWSLSREWAKVKRVAQTIAKRGWTLECAQMGWDAVSQMTRNFFHPERFEPAVLRRNRSFDKTARTTHPSVWQPHA